MLNPTFCFALSDPPRLVSVRGTTEALLGYSQRDFLTAKVNLKDLIHPDDAGMADYFFSNGLEIRTGCINIRLRHADGRIRCVKGCFTKKPARAGENVVLELTLEDARSVREPGDAFLLTSFKPLIEHTNDYIYIENRNHVILAVSPAVPFLTEVVKDPAELVGKTIYDLVPEAIADLSYELANRAFAENRSVHQIRQMAAQDGSNHWLDDRKYPITGPDGKIVGILGVVPDITEYVESRLRLRDSEESLREAQSIAGLGSYWLDINTDGGRVRMSWTKYSESKKNMSAPLTDGLLCSILTIDHRWLPISRMRCLARANASTRSIGLFAGQTERCDGCTAWGGWSSTFRGVP